MRRVLFSPPGDNAPRLCGIWQCPCERMTRQSSRLGRERGSVSQSPIVAEGQVDDVVNAISQIRFLKATIGRPQPGNEGTSGPKQSEHKQRERKRAPSDQRCQNQPVSAHRRTVRQIGRERKRHNPFRKKPSPSLKPVTASRANRIPWETCRPEKQSTVARHVAVLWAFRRPPPSRVIYHPDQEDAERPDRISP